jgi:Tol biopolymer transport system component
MPEEKPGTSATGPLGLSFSELALLVTLGLVLAFVLILIESRVPRRAPSTDQTPVALTSASLAKVTSSLQAAELNTASPVHTQSAPPSAAVTDTHFAPTPTPTAASTNIVSARSTDAARSSATPTSPPNATAPATKTTNGTSTSTHEPLPATSTRPLPTATSTPTFPATHTPGPLLPPTPTHLKGKIVFPVFDEEAKTYNIYLAKLDGSDRTLVVQEASQPTLNSTGKRIAFRSWQADNRGLIERGVEGGDIWRFDSYFESARPTFSPDDQTFLFQSREGGEKPAIYRTVSLEYEVLRREANPIQGEAPAWTPDGNSFVYKGCLGTNCGLILSGLDGSSPQQLTQDLSDTNPAVSPDGNTIVFMSQSNGTWDVYTVGIDGTGRKQLTTDPANDGLPIWLSDGKMIAFVSDRSGEWAMWAMNANGGNQRLLFALGGSIDGTVQIDVQNSFGWLEESIDWAP